MNEKLQNDVSYIVKKTEKIGSAIFLVTNLMAHGEPLRNSLRTRVLYLISDVLPVAQKDISSGAVDVLGVIKDTLSAVRSMCEIGRNGALMSDMNTRVIMHEVDTLLIKIENCRVLVRTSPILSIDPTFFNVATEDTHIDTQVAVRRTMFRGTDKNTDRRSVLMQYLREHPMSSVHEVASSPLFAGSVSEKTVQRELVSLVEEGSVKRVGERRWSRYTAAEIQG